jgi:arylsulfatase A-like enzyme
LKLNDIMKHILACAVAIMLALPATLYAADTPKPAGKPNVLFIAVDDLNHWVGHLGRNPQTRTPNIDRLAARGVTFSHAYCAVPACEPARAALMGGRRPWTTGCYFNGDQWKQYVPEGNGLTAQFLKAGYYVGGAGKIYHSEQYYPSEWSEYMDTSGLYEGGQGVAKNEGFHDPLNHDLKDEDLSDWHIVNWCIERLKQPRDKPSFIACGLHKPHLPFAVPRKYYDRFPLETIQLPPYREDDLEDIPAAGVKMAKPNGDHAQFLKDGNWKNAVQSYLATIAYTDMNIGRLLDAFDKSPARDNTIIVFWGDHGWSLGEKHHWRKFALWEEPTRAPLIWVAPGVTQAGSVCARPVDFMTIYPTLCELAGVPVPKHVEGPSTVPLLRDPQAAWDRAAITTHGYMNHTVRTSEWRYIRYEDGGEELYDESQDPYEWTNLAAKPELASVKAKLAGWLPTMNAPHKGKGSLDTTDEESGGRATKKGKVKKAKR